MASQIKRIRETHQEIQEMKAERREIAKMWRDELSHHEDYQELLDQIKALREQKKSIESSVKEASPKDVVAYEDLAAEIKASEELLSDLTFNALMNDESVELEDEYENKYVPQIMVKFKKEK